MKYYAAYDKDAIFGIGKSKNDALLDAHQKIHNKWTDPPKGELKTIEISKQIYDDIDKNGYVKKHSIKNGKLIYGESKMKTLLEVLENTAKKKHHWK